MTLKQFAITFLLVFASSASAGETTILHSFTAGADGAEPGGLVEISTNLFLGTTGTTFTVSGSGSFMTGTLLNPALGSPVAGQFYPASNGLFYGTTSQSPGGTAFVTTATGTTTAIATSLNNATPLVQASDGNFYGVQLNSATGLYEVFRMTPKGSVASLAVLGVHQPAGVLLQASDGNLYGATGNANGVSGFVFRVTLSGQLTIVAQFPAVSGAAGTSSGSGGLVEASNGAIYGVANYLSPCPGDTGFIYAVRPSGGIKIIRSFPGCPIDSPVFTSSLTQASDGMLYGAYDDYLGGRIFRLALDGSGYGPVGPFQGVLGFAPFHGVVQGSDGALYITFISGGAYGYGTVSRLDLGLPQPAPAPRSFRPAVGPPGTPVLINGAHMLAPYTVSFNGVMAKTVISRGVDYIVAVVPPGATSGPVTVTNSYGASGATTRSFTVQ